MSTRRVSYTAEEKASLLSIRDANPNDKWSEIEVKFNRANPNKVKRTRDGLSCLMKKIRKEQREAAVPTQRETAVHTQREADKNLVMSLSAMPNYPYQTKGNWMSEAESIKTFMQPGPWVDPERLTPVTFTHF